MLLASTYLPGRIRLGGGSSIARTPALTSSHRGRRIVTGEHNISLQLTPKVRLWFVGRPSAGVRFALMIRRGN